MNKKIIVLFIFSLIALFVVLEVYPRAVRMRNDTVTVSGNEVSVDIPEVAEGEIEPLVIDGYTLDANDTESIIATYPENSFTETALIHFVYACVVQGGYNCDIEDINVLPIYEAIMAEKPANVSLSAYYEDNLVICWCEPSDFTKVKQTWEVEVSK